eukprot:1797802-Amphidinium_carterae.2
MRLNASASAAQSPPLPAEGVATVIATEVRISRSLYKKRAKGKSLALLDSGGTLELALAIGKTMAYLQGAEVLLEDKEVVKLVPLLPLGARGFDFTRVEINLSFEDPMAN